MKAKVASKIPKLKATCEKFTEEILQEKYLDIS